jgi:4-aminobutyrate aminotransferase
VFLGNSGAEAVEAAIKLARYHTRRPYIIAFHGAFHGRTYGAVSLTASKAKQRAGFAPLLPGIVHVPYGHCYRCAYHLTYPECDVHCIESWRESLFRTTLPPDEVAAVFVEPILGEGGHIVPPPDYFPRLRRLCDDHGILLVADEIQSGMGRTGSFFALQHWGVTPDIITLGKGLGSGMPVSALMAKKEIMTWPAGSHGSTFGGNPVCCAAALATIDLVKGGLMENAVQVGGYLKDGLIDLQSRYEIIGDVRGRGLMLAMEFVSDRETKTEAPQLAETFVQQCFQKGLLVLGCGENSVRLAPPLIVTREDVDIALGIVDKVLNELNP